MTPEEKQLLLKDLCARLPYGVVCAIYRIDDWNVGWRDEKLTGYFYNEFAYEFDFGESPISIDNDISKIKPYLRPMSSMTEEEREEYNLTKTLSIVDYPTLKSFDWLTAHHFDYRGLIEKGLALPSPEGMYNINNKS